MLITSSMVYVDPGASSDPCQDSYRGTHAFSEREVKNVANYLEALSRNDQIAGYMDIHAYSQLWMTPWGYTRQPTRDNEELVMKQKFVLTRCTFLYYRPFKNIIDTVFKIMIPKSWTPLKFVKCFVLTFLDES